MMNLIQKFFKNTHNDKKLSRDHFYHYFFSLPEHQWIIDQDLKNLFVDCFQHLPIALLEDMMVKFHVVFILSKNISDSKSGVGLFQNAIVIFPKFQSLLGSKKRAALAYLAHELALIFLELEQSETDPLMVEVAADKFVCDIGLSNELEEFLLMMDETVEKRLRLTYLTINHFKQTDN